MDAHDDNRDAGPGPVAGPELLALRDDINAVDEELLRLLNRRAALSIAVGKVKGQVPGTPVYQPGRENELLRNLRERNTGPLPDDHLLAVYRQILSSSRCLQAPVRVAFLGPEGTFSHLAARSLLGEQSTYQAKADLEEVFRSVEEGDSDVGVVPLENSLHGSVGQSFDLFLHYRVYIQAEINYRIRHSLLSRCASLGDIRVVYSHAQPLAQCARWLRTHVPGAAVVPVESTSAAAAQARSEDVEAGVAAIAHADLAQPSGLRILAQGIEDLPGNRTRFVAIGARPADRPGPNKTSLLFSVVDKPGSLFQVLECFSRRGINLRKLESRPLAGEEWKYIFFTDLECDIEDPAYQGVLDEAQEYCLSLRVLGSYPAG
jgi:chorismate mutase/prephenate dehydratase